MDAAERRRIQNREAQRRFRSKQSTSEGKKAQQQGPVRRQNSTSTDSRSSCNLVQFSFDGNATTADDWGNLQDPTAATLLPLQLDLNVGGLDMRPSTGHVDCTTQWLNDFPLEKDAGTSDLRWNEIGHLTQLQQPSDTQSFHILQQPLSSQPAYGTPPETPKRSNPPHKTTEGGQVQESSDCNVSYDDQDAFQTALHIAANAGHDMMIDMLLANGRLAVDVRDSEGNTALHAAVASRKLVIVLRLLSHGADPDAENAAGWTPLHTAVQMGSVDIVGALVAHGGDVTKKAPMRNVDLME